MKWTESKRTIFLIIEYEAINKMTTELKAQITTGLDGIKTTMQERLKKQDSTLNALKEDLLDLQQKGLSYSSTAFKRKDFTADILESDGLKSLKSGTARQAIIPINASLNDLRTGIKSIVGDAGSTNDQPLSVQPARFPGIGGDARRALTLFDVMPRIIVDSGSYEFVTLDAYTNAADVQEMQSDTKAVQTMATELVTANISTVAVTLSASEQVLADSNGLQMFLSSKLTYAVLEKLEREMITATGGAGRIDGLINQATTYTASTNSMAADAIGQAIAELESTGWNAGLVILHPKDWHAIRSERDVNDGQYVAGGWNMPSAPNVWGVPVIASAGVTEGTALVLDPMQMAILDRHSPRFEIGRVDQQFAENMLTMRSELRAGLAVYSPSAILKLSI